MNIRKLDKDHISLSFDETTVLADIDDLFKALNGGKAANFTAASIAPSVGRGLHSSTFRLNVSTSRWIRWVHDVPPVY
jgi:hypothetical protein